MYYQRKMQILHSQPKEHLSAQPLTNTPVSFQNKNAEKVFGTESTLRYILENLFCLASPTFRPSLAPLVWARVRSPCCCLCWDSAKFESSVNQVVTSPPYLSHPQHSRGHLSSPAPHQGAFVCLFVCLFVFLIVLAISDGGNGW